MHALTWKENNGPRCLLDEFDVSYAPSAYVRGACHRRSAARRGFQRLVAVGNPLPHSRPLRFAEREAELVSGIVPAGEPVLLLGKDATKEAALAALPGASHIHLACHGRQAGDPMAFDSALEFESGQAVSAAEVLELNLSDARLVVASACETGVIPAMYEMSDEVLSLSTVFLGAGAAGVVASLWEVDDYATALLMTRFYEELAGVSGFSTSAVDDGP
jgi:CHAT domain-containing protein